MTIQTIRISQTKTITYTKTVRMTITEIEREVWRMIRYQTWTTRQGQERGNR